MPKRTKVSWIATGCLLIGIVTGVAGAQGVQSMFRVHYLNTGLFSLSPDDSAEFNVTLDDTSAGQPARVRLQFLDTEGTVIAHNEVTLQAGQSTSLRLPGPMLGRAHAEFLEPTLELTSRRAMFGTLEVLDKVTGERRPTCTFGPGLEPGRQ